MRKLRISASFLLSCILVGLVVYPASTEIAQARPAKQAYDHQAYDHEAYDHEAYDHEAYDHHAYDHQAHELLTRKGRPYFESRGEIVWEVPTDKKVIALSFDDGPNPKYTPQVLDLLKQYQAKATFFVLGSRVEKFPELTRRESEEGHEIANHTYTHCSMTRVSSSKLQEELTKAKNAIYSVTGKTPALFRPPTGFYNETIVNTARDAGYTVVMWSWHQDTRDWSNPGTQKIINQVLDNARNGDIVLFHDHGGRRRQTVESLRAILPELQQRGYEFVTISELLRLRQNNLPNMPVQK